MKKQFVSAAVVAGLAFGVIACGNDGNDAANNDTTSNGSAATNTTTEVTTATNTGNYAAMADSIERNSQQGYYLNPQSGRPYSKLNVDRSTGRVTNETGEPVWRYVDNRNWWVYGYDRDDTNNWKQLGEARMQGNNLEYKADDNNWVGYDARWKKDDDEWKKEWEGGEMKIESDGSMKIKTDDMKIKKDAEDGEMKIKTKDGKKIKVDEDGKVKTDN